MLMQGKRALALELMQRKRALALELMSAPDMFKPDLSGLTGTP